MRNSQGGGGQPGSSAFLNGGGEMGALIRAHDWSKTPLGPIETWPQSLRTATAILLRSPVPIVMLWGEDGIMIYNDAYSAFAAGRHPRLLGSKVLEGWPEVADFNANVMKVGLAGGTLAYRDQELTLYRKGVAEQVWTNLDYSPVLDESGRPAGVIAIVVETTDRVLAERRIVAERERLTQLFQQAPGFMAILRGADHVFELANPAYMRLIGHRDVIGKPIRQALPEIEGQGFFELLDHVYRTGETFSGTTMRVALQRIPGGPAEERLVDFVYQPITDADGTVSAIFVEGSDVTERTQAEAALRDSEARLRATYENVQVGICEVDLTGRFLRVNETFCRITGYARDALPGLGFPDITHPEDAARNLDELRRLRSGEITALSTEKRYVHKDGCSVWVALNSTLIRDAAGQPLYALTTIQDITERKRAEERQALLVQELDHRVKNTLATVQSLAASTLGSDQRSQALIGRFAALAHAHGLLAEGKWEGARLADIVEAALAPYREGRGGERVALAGEDLRLRPKAAQTLSMALHELATNAAKYGALSTPRGRLNLSWRVEKQPEGTRLMLAWIESGGPPVKQPDGRGFGSKLIEYGIAYELDGEAELAFLPKGLRCTLSIPLPDGNAWRIDR